MLKIQAKEIDKALTLLKQRADGDSAEQLKTVREIINNVRLRGDEALFEYTKKFDGFDINAQNAFVSEEEIKEAYASVDEQLLTALKRSAANIFAYHERQKRETFFDGRVGQRITPIASVGVYVPGGKASYPSSVLMNIIPAKAAGVSRIAMVTPADKLGRVNALTLVAAAEAGADEIIKIGGAQAVAALAYGTDTVRPVDKITGPGNIYVALAKREVFGQVGIDMIAGPSEVMIIADSGANPKYIAADFLSQAEHDEMAACVLATDSEELAKAAELEIYRQAELLPKRETVYKSIEKYGIIIKTCGIEEACEAANAISPEHLELCVREPLKTLELVKNAGSIFMGDYSPEPVGDYFAGPNHVLPTNGTARFFSPLSVDDFIKKSGLIYYSQEDLRSAYKDIEIFARAESLDAHANSVKIRFEEEN